MDPAIASASFAGLSAVTTIVTATVAVRTLSGNRRDSRDRSRPVVTARLKIGPSYNRGVAYLVVRNAGQSVARQMSVVFDPPLPTAKTGADFANNLIVGPFISQRYQDVIDTMAPGEQLSNVWRYFDDAEEGIPDRVVATLSYEDDHGRSYRGTFPLVKSTLATETASTPGGKDYEKRVSLGLEAIALELWRAE